MDAITTGEGYAKSNQPLIKALIRHVDALAKHMPRQQAAGWVFATVMAAWAEDHGLIPQSLRAEAAAARKEHLRDGGTNAGWIRRAYARLGAHPSTACLLDPRYSPLPEHDAWTWEPLSDLLDWWANEAPDLAYPNPAQGPASITGWIVADLLQGLFGDRIAGNAFCQTPWFVADLLCERTITPAAGTFPNRTLRVIDPAAGAGHLLVWASIGLHQLYTAGVPGRPPVTAEQSVRRIIEGVHGVELDPLTAAVARLRLTVLAGALLGVTPLRLDRIPAWVRPRIAVGNSLLAGLDDPNPPGTVIDDTADYPGILARGTYHAVIGNPPYKVINDAVVREAVRTAYRNVCHGKFPASVPFAALMFELAIRGDGEVPGLVAVAPENLVQDALFELPFASKTQVGSLS